MPETTLCELAERAVAAGGGGGSSNGGAERTVLYGHQKYCQHRAEQHRPAKIGALVGRLPGRRLAAVRRRAMK